VVTFSKLLASAARDEAAFCLDVPAEWMQGRSVFGGLQVAFALQTMRSFLPAVPLCTLHAELLAARDGYTSQSVAVFGPDGRALALGRQCMVVFG
jgi:hypothetical protein